VCALAGQLCHHVEREASRFIPLRSGDRGSGTPRPGGLTRRGSRRSREPHGDPAEGDKRGCGGGAEQSDQRDLAQLREAQQCVTLGHMKTISIRELHERTGAWVRKAVELGAITVTERGKPLVRLQSILDVSPANPFQERRLRPGYARLRGKLGRGTDSTAIISEDRERTSPS